MKRATPVATAAVATAALTIGAFWLLDDADEPDRAADLETSRSLEQPQSRMIDSREWRYESYLGVQVQVPADWEHGSLRQAWCAGHPDKWPKSRPGTVSRPGLLPAIGCPSRHPPAAEREPALHFDFSGEIGHVELGNGWVTETRVVDGVQITILADDAALRRRILDSAREVSGEDANGCSPDHRATEDRAHSPDGAQLTGAVDGLSVCRYSLEKRHAVGPSLLSSSKMTGSDAQDVAGAIADAPEGIGPNNPSECLAEDAYGDELIVLRVARAAGTQELLVRYSGCDHHYIDDGTTKRKLTRSALRPLLSGPHAPDHLYGSVDNLLRPR